MRAAVPLVRKLHLAQVPPFARNARAALAQTGVPDLDHAEFFRDHVGARCNQCDARPAAEVVGAWFTGAALEGSRAAEELARLRDGVCLRPSCSSVFYELTLTPATAVDWNKVTAELPADTPPPSAGLAVGGALAWKAGRAVRTRLTWRLMAAGALLLALLAWRQWWTGGSIPFVREAKTFTSENGNDTLPLDDGDPATTPPR